MSEEKIGMYTTEEIYDELANGFLHRSMVDAMYFKIKDLQQKVEQLEKELTLMVEDDERSQETIINQSKRIEQLEERCEYLERSNNRREDEIIELRDENVDLVSKNEQLENIRKEAIKIIKKQMPICIMPNNTLIHGAEKAKVLENLLNILNKGRE